MSRYRQEKIYPLLIIIYYSIPMVEKDEFDSTTESLKGKTAAVKTSFSNMKNNIIQALRE